MAALKPAFKTKGTVTAGNSSQTSDGAAALILMSREKAEAMKLKPMATFRSFAVAGVPPEIMGVGPAYAVPKALKNAGLTLKDIGLVELNEAFASQALYVIKTLGLNLDIVNVNGGAIAMGHPLGCTGAKLTTTLLYEMKRRKVRYGLVTMCIGGGMGAAGIFERDRIIMNNCQWTISNYHFSKKYLKLIVIANLSIAIDLLERRLLWKSSLKGERF